MSYGLRTWDQNGQVLLTVNSRLVRFHSNITVHFARGVHEIQIALPALTLDTTWGVTYVGYTYISGANGYIFNGYDTMNVNSFEGYIVSGVAYLSREYQNTNAQTAITAVYMVYRQ